MSNTLLLGAYGALGNSSLLFRNKVINGDMRIDQRNAGASVTPTNNQYTLDRWQLVVSQASKLSVQQNAGGVTPPPGFKNYLGVTSLSSYSVVGTDAFRLAQAIEGLNLADLAWGTAAAQSVTFSFWVRSSLTGTFGGQIINSAANRAYPFTYSIFSSDTWEYKTITIPGDTTGTWLLGAQLGLLVGFGLGYGSSLSGAANAWNAGTSYMPSGATSLVGTNGATFYITGVQLEAGPVATPFEHRPYGLELSLCQRYFYQITGNGTDGEVIGLGQGNNTTVARFVVNFPTNMRVKDVSPAIKNSASNFRIYSGSSNITTINTIAGSSRASTWAGHLYVVCGGGLTANGCYSLGFNGEDAISFNAEL